MTDSSLMAVVATDVTDISSDPAVDLLFLQLLEEEGLEENGDGAQMSFCWFSCCHCSLH